MFKALKANKALRTQILNSFQGTGLRLFSVVTNMFLGIVLTRLIGTEEFGRYVSYIAGAGLVATVASIGLPTLMARELAVARGTGCFKAIVPILKAMFGLHVLMIAVILGAIIVGADIVLIAAVYVFATVFLNIALNVFVGFERVITSQWVSGVVRPLFVVGGFFLLAWSGHLTAQTSVLVQAMTALLAAGAFYLLWPMPSLRTVARQFSGPVSVAAYMTTLRSGLSFAFSQALIMAMTQVDILILTFLRSPDEVAWYFAAARAAIIVSFFYASMRKIAEPRIVRMYATGERDTVQDLISQIVLLSIAMTLTAVVVALILARPYLSFYGPDFLAAFPAMAILLTGALIAASTGPGEQLLRASKADHSILVFAGVAVGTGTALGFVLVPFLGINGAAIATAVQLVIFAALQSREARHRTGLDPSPWHALKRRRNF